MSWQPGQVVAGRFEVRALARAGGVGQVLRAEDPRGDDVAIKVFEPGRYDAARVGRYAATLRAALTVNHPVVALPRIGVSVDAATPFVAGVWLEGEDLDEQRGRLGALPWERAAVVATRVGEALTALAAATGKAHAALKPGNVRCGARGEVWLLDFGISELDVQGVAARADGTIVEYRAPEQLEGKAGDGRSDVFSLAVLLFEMIAGVHPFAGPSAFKVKHRLMLQATPRLSELAPGVEVPRDLEDLLVRALARRPEERFADADALTRALAAVHRRPGLLTLTAAPTSAEDVEEMTQVPSPPAEEEATEFFTPRPAVVTDGGGSVAESPKAAVTDDEGFTEQIAAASPVEDLPETTEVLPAARPTSAAPPPGPMDMEEEATTALPPPVVATRAVAPRAAPAAPKTAPAVSPSVPPPAPAVSGLQVALLAALVVFVVLLFVLR
jgi:hypothetical protein